MAEASFPDTAPVIIVHSLVQATAALRAAARVGRPIAILSAPDAGCYAGPGWWRALVATAGAAVPQARFASVLDCGDSAGAALAAIRAQVEAVVFTGRADVARRLAGISAGHRVGFATERPASSLDLGDEFFAEAARVERRCADLLASAPRF